MDAWQAQFIGMQEIARRGGSVEDMTDALAEIRLPSGDGGCHRLGDRRDRASLAWSAQGLTQLDPEVLTPVIEGETESRALGRLACVPTAEDVVLRRRSPGHCVFWYRKTPLLRA